MKDDTFLQDIFGLSVDRMTFCRSIPLRRFVEHVEYLMKNDKEELNEEYKVCQQLFHILFIYT